MTMPVQPPNPAFNQGTNDAPAGPAPQPPAAPPAPAPQAPPAPGQQPFVPQDAPVPPPGQPAQQPSVRYFTADDVARIRQEEKDKLYGQIQQANQRAQSVEDRLAAIEAERKQAADAEAQAAEAARRQQEQEELSAKQLLAKREEEWEARLARMEAERQAEMARLAKEQEFTALQAYINRRAREEQDNIAPELIDLISGNTQEEVEASIQMLTAKTNQIAQNLGAAQQAQQTQMRGVSTAGYTAVGPMDNNPGQRQLTPEEIQNMPMSEWAKIRGQMLGNSATQADRGLYG